MITDRAGFRDWLGAFRLRTLPLAASGILTGAGIGMNLNDSGWLIFILALLTAFLLQILSNLANDYGDSVHGADNGGRVGPERAVQSGRISRESMKRAVVICAGMALVSGLLLLWFSLGRTGRWMDLLLLLGLGIAAIISAYTYTAGSLPYGYKGLGDVFVFLFFGLVSVLGTHYLLTSSFDAVMFWPGVWIGFQSCAVLNLNNLRDHINDERAGKRTLVVRLGYQRAKVFQGFLLFGAAMCQLIWALQFEIPAYYIIPALWGLLSLIHMMKIWPQSDPARLDPWLKVIALSTLVISVIYFAVS